MRLRHRKWADEVLANNKDIGKNLDDLTDPEIVKNFNNLEIGSGLGGFLLEISKQHPENRYLGVEINKNAFAIEMKKASPLKETQKNFLFLNAPIEKIFPMIQDGQLDHIYINFPDPWPKTRQKKKRLSYPTLLKEYIRVLKDRGTLSFRTDNVPLFEDSISYFMRSDFKDIQIIRPFYSEKTGELPATEYERKFREKGVDINLIIAKK